MNHSGGWSIGQNVSIKAVSVPKKDGRGIKNSALAVE